MSVIRIVNLNGGYGERKILDGISCEIEKGTFTVIAGPNGTGKTTLLKYLIKEIPAKNGTIFLNDRDLNTYSQTELARNVGFLSQYSTLDQDFSVKDVVSFGRFCHGDERKNITARDTAIFKTGIEHLKNKPVTRISGGEFQLVMLARVLCQDTEIILLDEPTNNLDPKHRLVLMNVLRQEVKNGKTVVAVLHDFTSILNYADNVILLKDGSVFATGKTKETLTEENIKSVFGVNCSISLCHGRFPSAFCYSLSVPQHQTEH